MAKNSTNKIDIEEQDYLSEEQKKKQEEEERKRKEREAAEKAAKEAAAKAFSEANGVTDNSAFASAQKHTQKVTPIINYKKAVSEAKNEHARKVSEGENITDNSAKAFADRAARKQATAQIVDDYRKAYRNTLEGAVDGGFFEKTEGPTARQQAQSRISENVADRMEGGGAPADYRGRQQERLSDNIINVYEGMDRQLRSDVYDSAVDNQASSMIAEWIYSPGAALAKYGTAAGEAVKQDDKQYISPAAAKKYNLGQNLAERAGADGQNGFTAGETIEADSGDIRKAIGDWILKAYEDNAALAYEEQANLRRQAALEQSETPLGDIALNLATSLNNMAVSAGYSAVTGMPLSSYMAFTGGADKTADYLEAGYNPLAAIGAGVAWGKVMKEIEGGSSFGHVSGGIVDTATKKIGNEAVKLAGKFVDGKTIATVVDLAKGPIAKRFFSGLGEGLEEVVEYNLEYVFDSILGRDDVSFDVKEMLYSGLLGALCGELFEFSTAYNIPAELIYHFSEDGKAERAADIKEYLDKVDPKILESVSTGDLKLVEDVMKNIPAKIFDKAIPVDGKSNPPSIGNNVFGTGIFGKADSGKNSGIDDGVYDVPTMEEWISNQSDDVINSHTPEQLRTMYEYENSVNNGILEFIEIAKENPGKDWMKFEIGEVTDRAINDIKKETGIDTTGYTHYMDADFVFHVKKRHGENGKSDQSLKNDEDIARIGYVLENYDSVNDTGEKSKKFKNKDGSYAEKIIYKKAIDGTYYIVEAVPDVKTKRLNLISAYISTKKETSNVRKTDAESPGLTSETAPRANEVSGIIIPTVDEKSNPPSIGNNVFGTEIFGKTDSGQDGGIDDGARSLDETVTPSMERANKNFGLQDWKTLAEGIGPEFGIWRMKDFARVLDSASKGNRILRQQLYELYEKPLNEAQGNFAKNYARKVEAITEKFKELGIKAESKESAAVQQIGEGVKEIDKKGNTVPYTLEDLKRDFPDSWENIKAGADYCRAVYDEFLNELNAMYSEIYPATVEQANERVSNYDKAISDYDNKIENVNEVKARLEEERTKKQAELSRKKPDTLIYAELQNRISNIDRKLEQADRIIEKFQNRKFLKEVSRDTLKAQIESGEILKNKQIRPRKDYFRHFQELTNDFAEIADIFSNDQRIPPNLAGKSEGTKPRTIWTSIAQSRSNSNYYTEDAVSGLLRYTEVAEKILSFDPLISHLRDVNSAIRKAGVLSDNEVKGKGTNAGQFAAWADDFTNQLAGKTNKLDRLISDNTGILGRGIIKAVEVLNKRVKSNAILGNLRSALVQIGNLPNATLYIQNPVDWMKGAISLANPSPEITEARKQSNFMNRRYMGDTIDGLTKEIQKNNLLGKPKEFALWMLGAGDKAAAELIWHSAYLTAIRNPDVLNSENGMRGYESAVDYADDITRRSVGGRGEGDIPYFEESKLIGLIAPFQIEVTNATNALIEQIGKKNAAGFIAFEISTWLINTVLESIIGDRPLGFDYIDVITDIISKAIEDDDEEEKDIWELLTYAGGRVAGETLSSMPLGTQVASIIAAGDEKKAEDWFGDRDPTRYGTGNIGLGALADAVDYFYDGETPKKFFELATDGKKNSYGEWSAPVLDTVDTFAPLVMPWGGKQLSRTLNGANSLIRGGAYGIENDGSEYLKFPQEYDTESVLKTILFGQYASDRGQDYIDSGFKDKLSAKQTEQMKLAENWGISNEEFYDLVLGLKDFDKKEEKQEALFANENFTSGEKGILEQILFGDIDDNKYGEGYKTRDYYSDDTFYRSGLSEGGKNLFDAGYSRKDIETVEEAVSGNGKKAEEIGKIAEALGISEAEAFKVYQERNGDWIYSKDDLSEEDKVRAQNAYEFYGANVDEYIKVLNYSKYGVPVEKEDGSIEYSTSMKDVVPNLAKVLNVTEKRAEELYLRVNAYDYSRADIEEEEIKNLDTAGGWYEVDDKGYFVAKNAILVAEGEKDKYGNTIEGSSKKEAIANIAKQLGIDEEEATIYYLAAEGELALSIDDLSSSHREDLETAIANGWTERQYLDAVNIVRVSGASKKAEIIKALMDAGAPYAMAQGYYNLRKDKDYNRYVGKLTIAYGMSTQKQADKIDYFIANYNSSGDITAEDLAKWIKATKGKGKKADYIAALIEAGAPSSLAEKIYALMKGYDKSFKSWYQENGG